jgi:hypothetical protein
MNGMSQDSTVILCWPKRLLSADDLRGHLTSQRELLLLPRTVITPLAADQLKAKGVRIRWQVPTAPDKAAAEQGTWCYAWEKHDAMISTTIKAMERDGSTLTPLDITAASGSWTRKAAEMILASYLGGIVFCSDPASACCVANKIAGMRAAPVLNAAQVVRAKKNLGPNLFAIEVPGPTFFEVRQILKAIVTRGARCPEEIANVLTELDGNAHR